MATEYEFPVEYSQILLFARALHDLNPAFTDPLDPTTIGRGGVVAPPTFTRCFAHWDPEFPLDLTRPRPADYQPEPYRGVGLGNGLHAGEYLEYHAPIFAGDTLTVSRRRGKQWIKASRNGNHLHFSETIQEFRNQHDKVCVVATTVAVRIEQPAASGADDGEAL